MYSGNNYGAGGLYSVTTAGDSTLLVTFDGSSPIGYGPLGGLVQARDGTLYGTAAYGGASDAGTVFKLTTDGILTQLYEFTGMGDGGFPYSSLLLASDGNLYGTAPEGGATNNGSIFKIDAVGTFSVLYSFTGGLDGSEPIAGLVQAGDGNLYGATEYGGKYGAGALFQFTSSGALLPLYSFSGGSDGGYPETTLTAAADGNIYGVTNYGGFFDLGTLFRISTGGSFKSLYSFSGMQDGSSPVGGLTQASDGLLYGTAYSGGLHGVGTLYRITTAGAFTLLYGFTGGTDGGLPESSLIKGIDGNLYGTTSFGGDYGYGGTIFELIAKGGHVVPIYSFTTSDYSSGGQAPVLQGADGNLYGTTFYGGTYTSGSVFSFGPINARGTIPTGVTVANSLRDIGVPEKITAVLTRTDTGTAVSGREVTFLLDGLEIGAGETYADGHATLDWAPTGNFTTGAHTLTARFAGDTKYAGISASESVTLHKGPTSVHVPALAGSPGKTLALKAVVTNAAGNPVSGATVVFSVAGVQIGAGKSNGAGVAHTAYTIPPGQPAGPLSVGAAFVGNSDYIASSGSGTLTVN